MRKKRVLALGVALLVAAGVYAWRAGRGKLPEVRVAKAEVRLFEDKVLVQGRVEAENEQDVVAPFAARLERLEVREGTPVAPGSLLGELASEDLEDRLREAAAAVEVAEAELAAARRPASAAEVRAAEAALAAARLEAEAARKKRERYAFLRAQGAVPEAEYEAVEATAERALAELRAAEARLSSLQNPSPQELRVREARLAQARAAYESARRQLEEARLVAPVRGVVLAVFARPGDFLQPGAPVVRVGDPGKLRVVAALGEQDAAGVKAGQEARVQWVGAPERVFKGRVLLVAPAVEEEPGEGGERVVKAYLEPEDGSRLPPGATVDVYIYRVPPRRAVLVPNDALLREGGRSYVWVVRGDRVWRREVVPGGANELYTEVRKGLRGGELVVLSPPGLRDGQEVRLAGVKK